MPIISNPNLHFDIRARAGNSVTPSAVVTDLNFTPNFVWTKQRDAVNYHVVADNISRSNVAAFLSSNAADAENTASSGGWYQSFDTNGYTTRAGSSDSANVNKSGINYIDWVWKAGGAATTNNNGSISAQVSANQTAGFSIVSYTGTGSNATVGHGLGVAPSMIIVKSRSLATSWPVYHIGLTSASYRVFLDLTNAQASDSAWNSTAPTSSVFSIGPTGYSVNNSSATYVAYCFASVVGYSAFGSYIGNSSTDGPFLYTGFRPRWVMLKVASGQTGEWLILDTSRDTFNVASNLLYANSTAAQDSPGGYIVDILSNGFKLRNSSFGFNNTSGTYIWAAFAETPFKYANAR
jgi:hypothetical protein